MNDETSTISSPRNGNSVDEFNIKIIVNLHPTDGTHCALFISGHLHETHYFDNFGFDTPPIFLRKYVALGLIETYSFKMNHFVVHIFCI